MKTSNLKAWLILIAVWLCVGMSPAQAQIPNAPPSWIKFAQLTGRQFHATLEDDNAAASQLHQFLEDRVLKAKDGAPATIAIRAWIGPDGTVTRVEFDSLGDPKADGLMRSLLTAHPIAEPPPPDMLQPLRLRLDVEPDAS